MKSRLKGIGLGLACLACGLPLIFAVTGATTGAAGAVGYWLGRIEALVVVALGLAFLIILVIRHTRARQLGPGTASDTAAEATWGHGIDQLGDQAPT